MDLERFPATTFGEARRTFGRHGYVAYFPAQIPRRLELTPSTISLLAEAESSLGRLFGVGLLLPDPELLTAAYVLREAVSSTRIEGTRSTMAEVLAFGAAGGTPSADVEEVLDYVDALKWGLSELDRLPLSVRLLRDIHRRLLSGIRGRERGPGDLRRSQNWIGGPNSTIETASFVPPPADEIAALLTDWERFAHEELEMPVLIQNALLHAQLETIHPFLDGNGRLGRLVLVLFLVARGRLGAPLLYLSAHLERERTRYYEALSAVRERGDPSPWLELFLSAVADEAQDAVLRAGRIVALREQCRRAAATMGTANGSALVDLICENPLVTTRAVEMRLGVTRPTALRLLRGLEDRGVLTEGATGPRGQRRYVAAELMAAVTDDHTTSR
ncbi:MAG TPA: Fic family protein [Solirubrobacteraceae bacterium]|nr:Fic family protein [Solirubrobacteraceae bacterium]